ncbi:MAG: hypothetical protein ACPLZY_02925 [Candidatus Norongarragalinales archaeon]
MLPLVMLLAGVNDTDAGAIIKQLVEGFGAVANAITSGIRYLLMQAGVDVPQPAITVGSIIFIILLLYKFGNVVNKIVLFALVFLLLSNMAGLLGMLL